MILSSYFVNCFFFSLTHLLYSNERLLGWRISWVGVFQHEYYWCLQPSTADWVTIIKAPKSRRSYTHPYPNFTPPPSHKMNFFSHPLSLVPHAQSNNNPWRGRKPRSPRGWGPIPVRPPRNGGDYWCHVLTLSCVEGFFYYMIYCFSSTQELFRI